MMISTGFRKDSGSVPDMDIDEVADSAELISICIPSITIKGAEDAFIELFPLMDILYPAPGSPECEDISSPATRPLREPKTSSSDDLRSSSAFTEEIAPVKSCRCCSPYPITTASSRKRFSGSSITSIFAGPVTGTDFSFIPIQLNTRDFPGTGFIA